MIKRSDHPKTVWMIDHFVGIYTAVLVTIILPLILYFHWS